MARKDLDKKQDSSNFQANKYSHPFYVEKENEIIEEEIEDNLQEENTEYEEEKHDTKKIAKNVEKNAGKAAIGYLTGNSAMMASSATNTIEEANSLNTKEKMEVAANVAFNIKMKLILLKLLPFILLGLLILFIIVIVVSIIAIDEDKEFDEQLATSGYVSTRCKEVTVIMTDKSNGYTQTGSKTYAFEDYIAGVVSAEVGMFNNLEVYKEFAIAARSYFLTHDDNCTIESSDRKQVFRDITDRSYQYSDLIYQAIEETKGKVILSNGEVDSVQYDAFCSIDVDNNYYTLKQANQKIPRSWVDSQSGIASSWKKGNCEGNHGNGLSQWGSYYLATEENYTFDELLRFYLGDEMVISRGSFASSIAGLEIKDTTDGGELHEALSTFLISNGSSIDEFNDAIHTSVVNNGAGTREGVVTAAVSLVNLLYDNYGVRIPYYWGGQFQAIGANPDFGSSTTPTTSSSGTTYYYTGLDCSGFVSWSIRNGGYNFKRHTTKSFDDDFGNDSCDIEDSSCIGSPGDLINSASCHVQMIVGVDEASSTYVVAESTGAYGTIMRVVDMHASNCGNKHTKIIYMDNFYDNPKNVDTGY